MKLFGPATKEVIGFYVYALADPRISESDPRRYFYFGKGKGDRCFAHAADELTQDKIDDGHGMSY